MVKSFISIYVSLAGTLRFPYETVCFRREKRTVHVRET